MTFWRLGRIIKETFSVLPLVLSLSIGNDKDGQLWENSSSCSLKTSTFDSIYTILEGGISFEIR